MQQKKVNKKNEHGKWTKHFGQLLWLRSFLWPFKILFMFKRAEERREIGRKNLPYIHIIHT